jgi:hypothetical protein
MSVSNAKTAVALGMNTHSVSVPYASKAATDLLRQPVHAGWRLFEQQPLRLEAGGDYYRQGT